MINLHPTSSICSEILILWFGSIDVGFKLGGLKRNWPKSLQWKQKPLITQARNRLSVPFTIAWKCFSHKKGILGSKLRPFRFVSKSLFDNPFSTNPYITHEPLPFPCPRTLPLSSCYFFIQPKPFYSKILPQIRKFQLVSVCIAFIILNKNPIQSSIHNRTIKTKIY